MSKLVILKFGTGNFAQGFPVTLQMGRENTRPSSEVTGELPPAPELLVIFDRWQTLYRSLGLNARPIGIPKSAVPVSVAACTQVAGELRDRLNYWLQAESFRPIREQWLEKLQPAETIRVILQTSDLQIQKLPWHLWDLIERYPNAEFAFSTATYEQVQTAASTPSVKILAILGDSTGIDIQADRALLEKLPDATINFLVEPDRRDLTDQLWEQNWDILFFAGHSASVGTSETGRIYINPTESLTIDELKYALRKAVMRGLKLAIFNSCDGLGLARKFADLQIPQMIVMREPVPDRVAQEFLKYFLEAFARSEPLYLAVREARERLQGLEGEFPCATWLPVIYQNLAETPMVWLSSQPGARTAAGTSHTRSAVRPQVTSAVLISMAIALLIMGIRYLGLLQPLELQAFDQFLQLRPEEKPDTRLLVVTITEEDVQAQAQETRRGSLSDQSLAKLLEKLASYQPQVIGLDIYRDYPVERDLPMLAEKMQQNDRLVAICKVSDSQARRVGVAPPPEIPPDRLGFSDLVLDADSVVRRQLLALTPPPTSPCTAAYAFSMQLALRYLAAQNATQNANQNLLKFSPDGAWQLGKTHFQPMETHTGGYQGIDAWGHQILLNYRAYRSPQESFPQVTLKQILSNQVHATVIQNRVVIIGTTAESFQDYSLTPYKTNQGMIQKVPGVILQAQMTSQLISAALGERSLLWTWTLWQESIWVMIWSVAGGLLAQFVRQMPGAIALGGAIVILYSICLIALVQGSGWIPMVPAVLALLGSSGTVYVKSYVKSLAQSQSLNRSSRSAL
ncbi:MAG TPA: CHASE2 domain-containing protein [Coleofasciculaceae cyanobacterium]